LRPCLCNSVNQSRAPLARASSAAARLVSYTGHGEDIVPSDRVVELASFVRSAPALGGPPVRPRPAQQMLGRRLRRLRYKLDRRPLLVGLLLDEGRAECHLQEDRMRISGTYSEQSKEDAMAWTTPTIVEVCAGFEVTAYASAE
jgi:coenzyme PQQ precursor peptide PqqA